LNLTTFFPPGERIMMELKKKKGGERGCEAIIAVALKSNYYVMLYHEKEVEWGKV